MTALTVTVVIPNWNGRRFLEVLLKQIEQQTYPVSDVLVVDNGSTDGSQQLAASLGCRVAALDSNRGFAAAVNHGIRQSATDLCLILNNDVELEPSYIDRLVHALGDKAFATGRILSASNHKVLDATFDLVAASGCAWRCGHGHADGPGWRTPRPIQFAPMTAMLVRRDAFLSAGGLDERYESYLEDVDFGLACASLGYTGRYVPDAVAFHVGSGTRGAWHPQTVRQIARNQVLVVAKWQNRSDCLRNGWRIAAGQVLWGMVAVKHGRAGAWFRGKIDGIRMIRLMRASGAGGVGRCFALSEAEIATLQHQTGWQPYWRLYFRLVGQPGPK